MVAVWYDGPDSSLARLLWAERPKDAATWSAPRAVGAFGLGYHGDGPARIAKLADGSLVLAWQAGMRDPEASRPLRLARLETNGGAWRQIAAPAGTASRLNTIELAAGPDGLHRCGRMARASLMPAAAATASGPAPNASAPPGRKVRVETSAGLVPMATSALPP
jgi:hypothetical protein